MYGAGGNNLENSRGLVHAGYCICEEVAAAAMGKGKTGRRGFTSSEDVTVGQL